MRAPRGQAWRLLHHGGRAALLVLLVAAGAFGVLAWRLAESPLASPWLADRLANYANARLAPARLQIGGAVIAWGGWRGAAAPFELRLTDVRLRDTAGALRAALPDAEVTLSVPALLRGRLAPASIALSKPLLLLRRGPDGAFGLDLATDNAEAGGPETPADAESEGAGLLAALANPAAGGPAASLRELRLSDGTLLVADVLPGRRFSFTAVRLDARRDAAGALVAEGGARLQSGALDVPVRVRARAGANAGPRTGPDQGFGPRAGDDPDAVQAAGLTAAVELPSIRIADIVPLLPEAALLARFDAPLAIAAEAAFDRNLATRSLGLRLGLGASNTGWPLDGADLRLALVPGGARLESARLSLGDGAATLEATGDGTIDAAGAWAGSVQLRLPPVDVARLGAAWPQAMASDWRARAMAFLPGGQLGGEARLAITAEPGMRDVRLAGGTARVALAEARIGLGTGWIPVKAAELAVVLEPDVIRIEAGRVRLADAPDGTVGPTVTLSGGGKRAGDRWRGQAEARLDVLAVTGLAHWWPEGLQKAEREWFTTNLTAGRLRDGFWRATVEAPAASPAALDVIALEGRAEFADTTIHWLRPVPPVVGVAGHAEFTLDTITVRGRSARQLDTEARPTSLSLREATLRFLELDTRPGRTEMVIDVAGSLTDTVALLRHPRLKLFEKRPLELRATGGRAEARVSVGFPLWNKLPIEELTIRAVGRVADGRIADALLDRDLEGGQLGFDVDTEKLMLQGEARLAGVPLRLNVGMDFRTGPPSQVIERATVTATVDAPALARLGFEPGGVLDGPVPVVAEARRQRNDEGRVMLRADLGRARMALAPLGWAKPAGMPANAAVTLRLRGQALVAAEAIRVEAPELLLRGTIGFAGGGRPARADLVEGRIGQTRGTAEVQFPTASGEPWRIALRGPSLDLAPVLDQERRRSADGAKGADPPLDVDLRFDRVTVGPGRALSGVKLRARTDAAGILREAQLTGRTTAGAGGAGEGGAVAASVEAAEGGRAVRATVEDTGALLRILDVTEAVRGGRLNLEARYATVAPGAPLTGTATLDGFAIRDAPAAGKLLQVLSVYGVVEAMQGGGDLKFLRALVPFTLTPEALSIADARAYSASLGVTARGRLLRRPETVELEGTIVPSYALNAALGNLPLVGRLFSAEVGGGVFAATWKLNGKLAEPSFSVNPLAAITPGFLRRLFSGRRPTPEGEGRSAAE